MLGTLTHATSDLVLNGLLHLSLGHQVLAALLLTHITMVAASLYLHRQQAHRALDLHPVVSHFFRLWLWLTTAMKTKEWVAVHRKHHAKCETEADPHSPRVFGIHKVLWQGTALYRREAANAQTLERYGKGTPHDWIERNVYERLTYLGIVLMLLIDLTLFGLGGLAIWALQMLWMPFWAAGVLNGIGHYWGYRNYNCANASSNIVPWGILLAGEELHNNHHALASCAKFSRKWWELDIGWMYIRVLESLRLARARRRNACRSSNVVQ